MTYDPYNHSGHNLSPPPLPKNQTEAILMHIQKHGEIDFLSAANSCGVSQLTARISELRRKGWDFDKKTTTGKNRYGNTFSKTIYSNARKVA